MDRAVLTKTARQRGLGEMLRSPTVSAFGPGSCCLYFSIYVAQYS
jgi:hypothetical protein